MEFERIKEASDKIKSNSDVFIVVGIGGSYLGSKACIDAIGHNFYNMLSKDKRKTPEIYYVGNNMSSTYILDLLDVIEGKDISINVISKSGNTIEPSIAFKVLKEYMEKKYGKEKSKDRIYVTTSRNKGSLRELANKEDYTTFIIPDNIGGRYSVFTPVGLFPMAVAGIDIEKIMQGALLGMEEYSNKDIYNNPSYMYAAIRNILYSRGKDIEILITYEPALQYFCEWWRQLYGESEGKDGKGIYPTNAIFTTDLHSMGQLIQDGKRNIFETTINIEKPKRDINIRSSVDDLDGLNFLEGKTLNYVNRKAYEGTLAAHVSGNVPNIEINIPELNEKHLGKLIYLFKKSCAISGYLLGVNPFNQPGVEEYKKNMFELLGKPKF